MSCLAIKGHVTRGEEVIGILKMLGGKNSTKLVGSASSCGYYIDSDGNIAYNFYSSSYFKNAIQFTLEEFLEKYPYKVGDKVYNIVHNENQTITSAVWDCKENEVGYQTDNNEYVYVNYLQPYKEETMAENTDTALAPDLKGEDYSGRRFGYKIPKGYEFECVRNNEIILKPIKPQYPKTYEECAKVLLERASVRNDIGYKGDLIVTLQKLLVCRDAYWKIAGEQMGLEKPWKPDWGKS